MAFLDGLLRDRFSTDGITFYQRSYYTFTSGNVTLTDDPATDTVGIAVNTSTLPGSGNILEVTADVQDWTPTDGMVRSIFLPGHTVTTTNGTLTDMDLYWGDTPIDLNYTNCMAQVSAVVTAWKDNSNCKTFRVSRSFTGTEASAPCFVALAATSDDGSVSTGTVTGWDVIITANSPSASPFKLQVTGAAATTIKWRGIVQVSIGIATA